MEPLKYLGLLPKGLARFLEDLSGRVPALRKRLEGEYERLMASMEDALKPYKDAPSFTRLPEEGLKPEEILSLMENLNAREEWRWKEGYASGAVYHGADEHIDFMSRVYSLNSQSNPLHADLWPSTIKYEAEIVAMTAHMLGAEEAQKMDPTARICGTVTSGGTESILMAMKAYRDWARDKKGITNPEMVLPETAHPAFEKAAHYFGYKVVRIPVDKEFRADVKAARRAITRNTVVLVGSAPSFPHGIIDPIPELSRIAYEHGIGFHTDACLGGFILPWAEKLGYKITPFDFRLPGVTSISADTHKYGYAAKGTSVILYRNPELRRYQYFVASDWPGGLYASPSIAGSRPGALIAICWAVMLKMGEKGYLEATKRILETARKIREGIESIPGLKVLGDPLWIIAFTSDKFDIYRVMEKMAEKGWSLNGLQNPPAVHIAVTLRHTMPGVAERFIEDLRWAVEEVKAKPSEKGRIAPIYGMAASLPFRGMVKELLKRYLDLLYSV